MGSFVERSHILTDFSVVARAWRYRLHPRRAADLLLCIDRSDKRRRDTKKGEFDKEKTNRRAISTVNGCLVAEKLSFLSLELRSCDIVHVTADKATGLFMCNRPCTDRKCHAALNQARIQWLTLTALAHKYRNFAQGKGRTA